MRPVPMKFCAHCGNERSTCEPTEFDGKVVLMCWDCREGPIRGGGYTFFSQRANGEGKSYAIGCRRVGNKGASGAWFSGRK